MTWTKKSGAVRRFFCHVNFEQIALMSVVIAIIAKIYKAVAYG